MGEPIGELDVPLGKSGKKSKGKGKGKDKGKDKGKVKGKGKDKGKRDRKGGNLERERISDMSIPGEIVEWKRKFGWIRPTELFEHSRASPKHDGKIFIHQKDVIPEGDLEVGQQVEFHIYADANGLGAEECIATS